VVPLRAKINLMEPFFKSESAHVYSCHMGCKSLAWSLFFLL
jgi:hypothetical protein